MTVEIPDLELLITLANQAAPLGTRLTRVLTTIGSDPGADVQLAGLPARWAVVQRDAAQVAVRLLGTGKSHPLREGEELRLEGVRLTLHPVGAETDPGLPVQSLADRLSEVESPKDALSLLLEGVLAATAADSGAIILREGDAYGVAVAQDLNGDLVPDVKQLLSDHILIEVLKSGSQMWIPDLSQHPTFANVPSVVALKLHSVLCVPMQLYGTVLGAIYLGKRELEPAFSRRQASDLALLASLAVPLLIQLRRARPGTVPANRYLVGECQAIRQVRELINRVAPSDLSVLVLGDTGTGKELVAAAVHAASSRAGRNLVAINCAAIPRSLLEAEMFGYKRGAFTGAVTDRQGRIEQAHQSTLFLDEVGDMPMEMQAALLRVLENHEVTRIGENLPRPVDFRLIAATHRALDVEVAAGRFRADLLFRLKEFTIILPPLSKRGADVLLLAHLFLHITERELGLSAHRIGQAAAEQLMRHPWPGNVRELRSTLRRAAILCDGPEILTEHLGLGTPFQLSNDLIPALPIPQEPSDLGRSLAEARDEFVSRYVAAVLERHGGDREVAAASLRISVRSLYRYLSINH